MPKTVTIGWVLLTSTRGVVGCGPLHNLPSVTQTGVREGQAQGSYINQNSTNANARYKPTISYNYIYPVIE